MTSLLHQLENNEAILLMYLGDEMSAEDRAEVDQMLASDASMRTELDRLRALRDETFAAIGALEAHARLPVAEGVAVRRATRMMRQWQIENARASSPEEPLKELRFPWWSYPLTTAAAVLIAFLVWWGNRAERIESPMARYSEPIPSGPTDLEGWQAEAIAEDLRESFEITEEDVIQMAMNQQVTETVRLLASKGERLDDGI